MGPPPAEAPPIRRALPPAVLLIGIAACSRPPAPEPERPKPADVVHNLRPLGEDLWSGATPEGDESFQALRDLGIKTIISVDGTRPDVGRARRFGIRYVHIPVGYGGVPSDEAFRLAEGARVLPRPIYVHCHHGRHRGPTAAALMRRCGPNGWTEDEAVAFLQAAGTDPKYEGLFASVRDVPVPQGVRIWGASNPFPQVADVGNLTARMVEIDDIWATIVEVKNAGWNSVHESPAHLALRLNEQYRETARLPDHAGRPESYRRMLTEAEHAASDLEAALRAGDPAAAGKAFDRSAALCSSCHREHRDRPRP